MPPSQHRYPLTIFSHELLIIGNINFHNRDSVHRQNVMDQARSLLTQVAAERAVEFKGWRLVLSLVVIYHALLQCQLSRQTVRGCSPWPNSAWQKGHVDS